MKRISWTRRNKLFAGLGGLGVVLVAVVLVFSFVGMPGGGKLFGTAQDIPYYYVEVWIADGYSYQDNEAGYDELRIITQVYSVALDTTIEQGLPPR